MPPKTYKIVPSNKYSARWTRAKKKFKTDTGEKYPATTKALTLFGRQITTVREGQGIEKALKAIESAAPKAAKTDKGLLAFRTAVTHYNSHYPTYLNKLNAVINTAPPGVNAQVHKRAVKALKKELEEINRAVKDEVIKAKVIRGDLEDIRDRMENVVANAYQAAERARLWIVQQRQHPDPTVFNRDIGTLTRDITEEIGNIDRYKYFGFEIEREQPQAYFDILEEWSDKGRKVDDNASRQAVLAELREVEAAVLGVRQWAR